MNVKEFIKKLKKLDQKAEVITHDSENGFYSAALIYSTDNTMADYDSWVSLEDKPRPDKIVLIG